MARTQSYAGRKSKTTEADKKAAKARKAAKAAAAVDSSDEEAAPAPAGPSLRDAEVKNVAVVRGRDPNAGVAGHSRPRSLLLGRVMC